MLQIEDAMNMKNISNLYKEWCERTCQKSFSVLIISMYRKCGSITNMANYRSYERSNSVFVEAKYSFCFDRPFQIHKYSNIQRYEVKGDESITLKSCRDSLWKFCWQCLRTEKNVAFVTDFPFHYQKRCWSPRIKRMPFHCKEYCSCCT